MKFKAGNGKVKGHISTGPKYSVDELEEGEEIFVSNQERICEITEVRKIEGDPYVEFKHPSCPFLHLIHVNEIDKIED